MVALIKSLNHKLSPLMIKGILKKSCYKITQKGSFSLDINPCDNVIDIYKAIKLIK